MSISQDQLQDLIKAPLRKAPVVTAVHAAKLWSRSVDAASAHHQTSASHQVSRTAPRRVCAGTQSSVLMTPCRVQITAARTADMQRIAPFHDAVDLKRHAQVRWCDQQTTPATPEKTQFLTTFTSPCRIVPGRCGFLARPRGPRKPCRSAQSQWRKVDWGSGGGRRADVNVRPCSLFPWFR